MQECFVVISNSTREFDKEDHYIIPDALEGKVVSGVRVIVPLDHQTGL
jgi:primosomal protein N' (replication factor Y)